MSGCSTTTLKRICSNCGGEAEYLGNGMGFQCKECGKITPMLHSNKTYLDEIYKELEEQPKPSANVMQHERICTEMNALYARKNRDYGDSFHLSFEEEGMAMARIRLGDKLNRFKTLTKNNDQLVQDESIRDTLIDLANYAIMTVMEIDRMGEGK